MIKIKFKLVRKKNPGWNVHLVSMEEEGKEDSLITYRQVKYDLDKFLTEPVLHACSPKN